MGSGLLRLLRLGTGDFRKALEASTRDRRGGAQRTSGFAGVYGHRLFDLEGRRDVMFQRCPSGSAEGLPEYLVDMRPEVAPPLATWLLILEDNPGAAS